MFRLVGAVLDALESGLPPHAAVRYFEFWTLRLHGLLPELDACGVCLEPFGARARRWGSPVHGVLCARCRREAEGPARLLRPPEREFLAAARGGPPADVAAHAEVAGAGGGLELLLRGTLESFVERSFRTYRHLDALAGSG